MDAIIEKARRFYASAEVIRQSDFGKDEIMVNSNLNDRNNLFLSVIEAIKPSSPLSDLQSIDLQTCELDKIFTLSVFSEPDLALKIGRLILKYAPYMSHLPTRDSTEISFIPVSALAVCVLLNSVDKARILLENGAHLFDVSPLPCVYLAMVMQNVEMFALLVKYAGVGLFTTYAVTENTADRSLLQIACTLPDSSIAIIEALVQMNDDAVVRDQINAQDRNGLSCLSLALRQKNAPLVKFLLEKGANMMTCALKFEDANLLQQQFSSEIDIHLRSPRNSTPLHFAASADLFDLAYDLIARGIEIDARNSSGRTALHIAAASSKFFLARLLISKGANLNSADNEGKSVLHLACQSGCLKLVEKLLDFGVDMDVVDKRGRSVLFDCVEFNHAFCCRTLLHSKSGAKLVNRSENEGIVPLMIVESVEVVKEFIACKDVQLNYTDADGKTALHHHVAANRTDVVRWLVKVGGASVTVQDSTGAHPVDLAGPRAFQVIVFLLENGSPLFRPRVCGCLENKLNVKHRSQVAWALHSKCSLEFLGVLVRCSGAYRAPLETFLGPCLQLTLRRRKIFNSGRDTLERFCVIRALRTIASDFLRCCNLVKVFSGHSCFDSVVVARIATLLFVEDEKGISVRNLPTSFDIGRRKLRSMLLNFLCSVSNLDKQSDDSHARLLLIASYSTSRREEVDIEQFMKRIQVHDISTFSVEALQHGSLLLMEFQHLGVEWIEHLCKVLLYFWQENPCNAPKWPVTMPLPFFGHFDPRSDLVPSHLGPSK